MYFVSVVLPVLFLVLGWVPFPQVYDEQDGGGYYDGCAADYFEASVS